VHHFVQGAELDGAELRFESGMRLDKRLIQFRFAAASEFVDRLLVNRIEHAADFVKRRILFQFGDWLRAELKSLDESVRNERLVCFSSGP
jgi:hypothetical protein